MNRNLMQKIKKVRPDLGADLVGIALYRALCKSSHNDEPQGLILWQRTLM